jgi:prefoldin subunit 5
MNNDEVIEQLNMAIQELEKRLKETRELLDREIKSEDFFDIEKRVLERASSLNLRIHHLLTQRRNRELLVELDKTINPLPKARVKAMQEALEKISASIAATKNLQAALELAATISQAASDMDDATKPTTA